MGSPLAHGISLMRNAPKLELCNCLVGSFLEVLGVERHRRVVGDVDPDVDVRLAAEVPDERRAFQPPVVPLAVVADVAFLVERQASTCPGRPASSGTPAPRPGPPCGTARSGSSAPSARRPSGPCSCPSRAGPGTCRRCRGSRPRSRPAAWRPAPAFCCLPSRIVVDLVGQHGLVPEDVAGMVDLLVEAARGVAVEDRAAQGHVRLAVAVGADGHVPAGHDELELAAARLAEDGAAQAGAPRLAAVIVLELLEELLVPVGIEDALEDVENERLLVLGVETAGDRRFGDGPEVGDVRAQQAALRDACNPSRSRWPFSGRRSGCRRGP